MASEIYALTLDGEVRYVGCSTKGATERWRQHKSQARCSQTSPLEKWIVENERDIEVTVLDTVQDEPAHDGYGQPLQGPRANATRIERAWVTRYMLAGHDLFNRSKADVREALDAIRERSY